MGPRNPEASHKRQRESGVFHKAGRKPVVAARHGQDLGFVDQFPEFVGGARFDDVIFLTGPICLPLDW